MKISRLISSLICGFLISACASSPKAARHIATDENDVQKMTGFNLLETNGNYQKFSFRDQGDFLVSKTGFSHRKDAIDFCKSNPGYDLSNWVLPGVMTMSSLPFDDLRRNNLIDSKVLDGSRTLSGDLRSGLIFWIKGKTAKEEVQISKGSDLVYEMLNGCGPGCDGVEALALINQKLKTVGEQPRAPLAICTSEVLQQNLNK